MHDFITVTKGNQVLNSSSFDVHRKTCNIYVFL